MESPNKKLWIKTGSFFILAGIVVFVILLTKGTKDISKQLIRFEAPSTQTLELTEGHYNIYHEYKTFFNNVAYNQSENDLATATLQLTDSEGSNIQLSSPIGSSTYSFNYQNGYAISSFDIESAGVYTLEVESITSDKKFILAIGHNIFEILFKSIMFSIIVLMVLVGVGIVIILRGLGIMKR